MGSEQAEIDYLQRFIEFVRDLRGEVENVSVKLEIVEKRIDFEMLERIKTHVLQQQEFALTVKEDTLDEKEEAYYDGVNDFCLQFKIEFPEIFKQAG